MQKGVLFYLGFSALLLISAKAFSSENSPYFSLGAGLEGKQIDNTESNKQWSGGGNLTFDLGYRFKKFALQVHSNYSGGYFDKLALDLNGDKVEGKFGYHSASVSPQIKYLFTNHQDNRLNFYMLAGPVYQWTQFHADKASTATQSFGSELDVAYHGYGGLAAIGLERNTNSTYVDRVFYQLSYKYVDYKKVDADWEENGRKDGFKANSRHFNDQTIAFNVGFTFSDKLFTKLSQAAKNIPCWKKCK